MKYLKRILNILIIILQTLFVIVMFIPLLILSLVEIIIGNVIYYIITGEFNYTEFIYNTVYKEINIRFNCNFEYDDFTVVSFLPINLIFEI